MLGGWWLILRAKTITALALADPSRTTRAELVNIHYYHDPYRSVILGWRMAQPQVFSLAGSGDLWGETLKLISCPGTPPSLNVVTITITVTITIML